MRKATSPMIRLGSARRETQAIERGTQMELVPGLFYKTPGMTREIVRLGSARETTQAVASGSHQELNSVYRWTPGQEVA